MSKPDDSTRCTHTTADNRRCRMPRANAHVSLCGMHLETQQGRLRSDRSALVHDALAGINNLRSATAVNHLLGNLAGLLADRRLDYRTAMVLAYMCQLLLQTINMAKHEGWGDAPPPPPSLNPEAPLRSPL